jgi:hypothetical protein
VKTVCFALSLIVGLAFASSVLAQETKKDADLASLQEAYRGQVSKIDAKYAALKEKIPADYTNALNALELSFTKKGDLDSIVAVRAERDRFLVAQDIPSEAVVKSPPALKVLQERFQKAVVDLEAGKKKDIAAVTVPYMTRLEQLKTSLTKNSKVDDALLVKTEIDNIRGSVDVSALDVRPGANQTPASKKGETPILPTSFRNGLVLYYSFDKDEGGKVTDKSLKGNDGKAVAVKWTRQGKIGGALSFHAGSQSESYVQAKNTPSLTPSAEITVAAWVKPDRQSRDIVSKDDWERKGSSHGYVLRLGDGGRPNFNIGASGWHEAASASAIPLGEWSHLAGTYDGNTLRFFVDGEEAGSVAVRGKIEPSNYPLRIGESTFATDNSHRAFYGSIGEVMIWDRALSEKEVRQVFEATEGETPSSSTVTGPQGKQLPRQTKSGDLKSFLVGTTWTWHQEHNEIRQLHDVFTFITKDTINCSVGIWSGTKWKVLSSNKIQLMWQGRKAEISFSADRKSFSGFDFDGKTPLQGELVDE